MTKEKIFPNCFIVCLTLITLITIAGCSTDSNKNKIISIQKSRIQKLENQLQRKNEVIGQLKANKWVNKTVKKDESVFLAPLNTMIKKGQWIKALKESSRLKKLYPFSAQLRMMRVKIFNKMGLKQQAQS